MYDKARRSIKNVREKMNDFSVELCVQQKSVLSLYFVMDEITKSVQYEVLE